MAKRRAFLAGRAWNLVRLTLIWARKGGAFRRGLMLGHLRLLKTFRHGGGGGGNEKRVRYMEREFSFDETPAFHFRMHRPASMRLPRLPCITPSVVDLDDEDRIFFDRHRGRHFFETQDKEEDHDDDDDDESNIDASVGGEGSEYGDDGGKVEELEGVDSQAEEFIARFYQQMKFQRQVSLLEYHEMLHRGMS